MPLHAVILSGGKGTRLGELTVPTPKPMLNIGGRPHLEHIIVLLKEFGVEHVIFSTGYLHESIENHFGDGSNFGIKFTYRVDGDKPLGTAGALKNCEDILLSSSEPDFLVFNGDILTDICYTNMVGEHRLSTEGKDGITIALTSVSNPSQFGIARIDNKKRIVEFIEKPNTMEHGNLANAGIYMMHKAVLNKIPKGEFCMLETDIFPQYSKELKLYGHHESDMYWVDIGTPERYDIANNDYAIGKLAKLESYHKKNFFKKLV